MSARARVHRVPASAHRLVEVPFLRIEGLVARPIDVTPQDLAALPRHDLSETFTCDPEREASGQRWRGVQLADVVDVSKPLPEARFIRVCSGGFVVPIPIEEARDALLCDSLNGVPLTLERGAPWRLIVPGGGGSTSVKWVQRIELAADSGRSTPELIKRARATRHDRTV